MSNAKRIYQAIIDEKYILTHLVGQPVEDSWLDCKLKQDPSHGKLSNDDKNNFAKALSGFANTSGGVLIFGIDARKINDVDVVQGIIPIKGLLSFESELRDQESRIVQRAISGLEYEKIYTDEAKDTGIIKIYIPEGTNPPYRSMRSKEFYIRAGDSFVPVDVPFIESLMLKKVKPDIEVGITLDSPQKPINAHQHNFYNITFRLTNVGNSIAEHVLLDIRLPRGSDAIFAIDNSSVITQYKRWNDSITNEVVYEWYYLGVLHPHRTFLFPLFQLEYHYPVPPPPLIFELGVYAQNMSKKTYSINMDQTRTTLSLIGGRPHQLTIQDFSIVP